MQAFAVEIDGTQLNYYLVISKRDWELAPGIRESEIILNNEAGSKRQVSHVVEIDISNPYTKVMPSTYKMADGLENKEYSTQIMSEQAAYAEQNGYGNVVAAMNTALHWYDTDYYKEHPELIGEPLGLLIMDGVLYENSQHRSWGASTCLVINFDEKDGVSRPAGIPKTGIRQTWDAITGWEEQLIPVSFHFLVKDGVNQHVINDPTEPAPRSFIGIKEDGTIILVMNEGRQAPFSTGFNCYEMAEFMISLGCVWASNCDGGGSSTFLSQRPGEELALHCSPSDGMECPTTHGVLVISTAPAQGELEKAVVSAEADYYTPDSTIRFFAKVYDASGAPADIPANALWQMKDASFGTLENGLFQSNGKEGAVTVQLCVGGKVVGENTVYIVKPDTLSFMSEKITVGYNEKYRLSLNATYEGHSVALQDSDVVFDLSNPDIGSIDGFYFTAASQSAAPSTLTAVAYNLTATAELTIGRGSELIYSFENGHDADCLDGWTIQPRVGSEQGSIRVVNRSGGKVRNGDFALAVDCDFTQIEETGSHWLTLSFPEIDCTDATRIGFWVYVPWDAHYSRLYVGDGCNEGCFFGCPHNCKFFNMGDGWYYATASVESGNVENIRICVSDEYTHEFNVPYKANMNSKYTLYIDDITVDYSDAVSDRHAPTLSSLTAVNPVTGQSETLMIRQSGQTFSFNKFAFETSVAENTDYANASGIDEKSAKAWIDGVAVDCVYSNGKIRVADVMLHDGFHTVKNEVADNAGNAASKTSAAFLVQGGSGASAVRVAPQNANAQRLPIGSLYWLDVTATDIGPVDKITLALDLNTGSSWEPEGMTLAEDFTASYAIQREENVATIVIERTGENNAAGEAVLACIPVRTWVSKSGRTPADLVKNGDFWAQSVEITLKMGQITYADTYATENLGVFGMENILVETELFFNGAWSSLEDAQAWIDACVSSGVGFHQHAPVALSDQPATCTQPGYTGRTFCEGCSSVVEWGTTVSATGHAYGVEGDKLACHCGRESGATGLQTINGKTYYAVNGMLVSGWVGIEDSWYYFDETTYAGADGEQYTSDGVAFTFDNGRATTGVWVENSTGLRYWYGPGYYKDSSTEPSSCKPYEIGGKTYLFNRQGYMQTGVVKFFNGEFSVYYDCGADGAAVLLTGPYNDYFYQDGIRLRAYQLVEFEGNYYYVSDGNKLAKNVTLYLNKVLAGTGLAVGKYAFDADGKMILEGAPHYRA